MRARLKALPIATIVLSACLAAHISVAWGQSPVYNDPTPALDKCLSQPDADKPLARGRCMENEHDRQTKRMTDALAALDPLMDDWQRQHLRQVQMAWERWMELRCFFIDAEPDSGSGSHSEAEYCLANTTTERADELHAMRSLIAPGVPP